MANSNIRVDVLFKTVKDLQQEKACLEQKLRELRAKRSTMQNTLEGLAGKFTQVKDVNSKMSETVKVAQHKVAQTQHQSEVMGIAQQRRRQRLAQLNLSLQHERQNHQDEVVSFEDKLSALTAQFLEAKCFYNQNNMQLMIVQILGETRGTEAYLKCNEREMEALTQSLHKLSANTELEDGQSSLPVDEQCFLVEIFESENQTVQEELNILKKDHYKLSDTIRELEQ